MNIYIICPVRGCAPAKIAAIRRYAADQRLAGNTVHFPTDDVNQDDATGSGICRAHLAAMVGADEVHIFWDVASKGSHFDLGMAYALGKRLVGVECFEPDTPGKSYWKVINERAPHAA